MATAKADPRAVLLGDGRVLVIEGRPVRDPETGAWGPLRPPDAEVWDPATGAWQTTESLNSPRTRFVAVPLADGRALVTGGLNDIEQSYSSAYVYDPRPGHETWTKVGLMDTARTDPSAAVLPDGRVLVAGGYFHVKPTFSRDAAPDTMLAAYRPTSPRDAELSEPPLADTVPPNVGAALATAELFDPATGSWSLTGSLNFARYGAAAVTLADGRVLVVGGGGGDGSVTVDGRASDNAEIYDPGTGRFSLAGTLPDIDRSALEVLGVPLPEGNPWSGGGGTLVALNDGGALLVAHVGYWKHQGLISRSLRFDPETETWTEVGQPYAVTWDHATGQAYETPGVPRMGAVVAPLPDGRVLVAGGGGTAEYQDQYQTASLSHSSAELYDPTTDTWSPLPPMPEARAGGTAVVLTDGSVLLVGGYTNRLAASLHETVPASAIRFVPPP